MILRISSIDEDPGKQVADFRSLVSETRNKKKLSLSSRALQILRHLQKMKQKLFYYIFISPTVTDKMHFSVVAVHIPTFESFFLGNGNAVRSNHQKLTFKLEAISTPSGLDCSQCISTTTLLSFGNGEQWGSYRS